jgi:serine protease
MRIGTFVAFTSLAASASVFASPTRYVVHFGSEASALAARKGSEASALSRGEGPRHVRSLAAGGELFEAPDGDRGRLATLPGVVSVEEDLMLAPHAAADSLWKRQWYMHDARFGVDAEVAWKYTRGAGAVVAVLDTGITPHPEFDGQLLPGYDFISDADNARDGDGRDADPSDPGNWRDAGECGKATAKVSTWHGTHVAGLIVAREGNGPGIVGLAPEAKVVPVRVLGRCGGRSSDVADAIVWASGGDVPGVPHIGRRVDVVNVSMGTSNACPTVLRQAIEQARSRGTVVVTSAGNDQMNVNTNTPANCPGVVSVAALARNGAMAWYSNFGEQVTLSAPGGDLGGRGMDDILSTWDLGKRGRERSVFGYRGGTSVAAPQVAALVALMRSADPEIGVDEVRAQLVDNARPLPGPCPKGCGAGLMDAGATVDAVVEDRARRTAKP